MNKRNKNIDDFIGDLEMLINEIDRKIKPGYEASALKTEEPILEFKNKGYMSAILGVDTADVKKAIAMVEENLDDRKKMAEFRKKAVNLLESVRDFKQILKESVITTLA